MRFPLKSVVWMSALLLAAVGASEGERATHICCFQF